jgi:hypothetical protein
VARDFLVLGDGGKESIDGEWLRKRR